MAYNTTSAPSIIRSTQPLPSSTMHCARHASRLACRTSTSSSSSRARVAGLHPQRTSPARPLTTSPSSPSTTSTAGATAMQQQLPPGVASLLTQLRSDIAANGGALGAGSTSLLTSIQAQLAAAGYVQTLPPPSVLAGDWASPQKSLTMKEVQDNKAVLSRFCWGLFQPSALPVRLGAMALRYGADGSFNIVMHFTVLGEGEGGGEGPAGVWEALGAAAPAPGLAGNTEQVTMRGGRISPAPGTALAAWLAVFGGVNPGMGADGVAEAALPAPMVAFRDVLVHDGDLLVQLGRGSHGEVLSVLQRVAAAS